MKPTAQIKELIKQWEGCSLRAYRCAAGVWTIGYGHTGADVAPGLVISAAHAEELFEADCNRRAAALAHALQADGIELPEQCRFDALLSLCYNIGIEKIRRQSTLWRKLRNNPADPSVADEFLRWHFAAGRPLPGLKRRRQAEANIYRGIYPGAKGGDA